MNFSRKRRWARDGRWIQVSYCTDHSVYYKSGGTDALRSQPKWEFARTYERYPLASRPNVKRKPVIDGSRWSHTAYQVMVELGMDKLELDNDAAFDIIARRRGKPGWLVKNSIIGSMSLDPELFEVKKIPTTRGGVMRVFHRKDIE